LDLCINKEVLLFNRSRCMLLLKFSMFWILAITSGYCSTTELAPLLDEDEEKLKSGFKFKSVLPYP